MSIIRYNECMREYEDYCPSDYRCIKCHGGTVRIINSLQILDSTRAVDKYAGVVGKSQNCNLSSGSLAFCTLNRHDT